MPSLLAPAKQRNRSMPGAWSSDRTMEYLTGAEVEALTATTRKFDFWLPSAVTILARVRGMGHPIAGLHSAGDDDEALPWRW